MNDKKCLAALFDLDGVVFDTEPQYTMIWGKQFRKYYPGSTGMEQKIKGQTLVQIFDRYFTDPQVQAYITKELDEFEKVMTFDYVNGFEPFIKDLRYNGIKTAVVTSSNNIKMKNVYAKHPEFKSYFDEILTSEDFDESKPSPDCYLKAASRFGFSSHDCVVFEDSINGLKSGKAAEMFVIGLSTTNPASAIAPYSNKIIADYTGMNFEKLQDLFSQSK